MRSGVRGELARAVWIRFRRFLTNCRRVCAITLKRRMVSDFRLQWDEPTGFSRSLPFGAGAGEWKESGN